MVSAYGLHSLPPSILPTVTTWFLVPNWSASLVRPRYTSSSSNMVLVEKGKSHIQLARDFGTYLQILHSILQLEFPTRIFNSDFQFESSTSKSRKTRPFIWSRVRYSSISPSSLILRFTMSTFFIENDYFAEKYNCPKWFSTTLLLKRFRLQHLRPWT